MRIWTESPHQRLCYLSISATESERCIAFHRMMRFRFEMWQFQVSDYRLVNGPAEPPLTLYWPLCWVSTDTIDPRTAHAFQIAPTPPHPPGPCLPPHIMHAEIKARQAWKVAGQKFELKKREEEKRKNGGSLSCGALPLKASWPAICAGSLAIATTPGRERGERQQGRGSRVGGREGRMEEKKERQTGNMREEGVDEKLRKQ